MLKHILHSLIALYSPVNAVVLARAFRDRNYSTAAFSQWLWHTEDFDVPATKTKFSFQDKSLIGLLWLTEIVLIIAGCTLIYTAVHDDKAGGVPFGLAVLVAIPIVLGVLVPLLYMLAQFLSLLNPKYLGKILLCTLLEWQVRRLRSRHKFQLVAVAGSMGKTSTKLAVAKVMEATGLSVRYQEGNYNDRLTVPLVIFEHTLPSLYSLFAWVRIFRANERTIRGRYDYDIVVVELGTDHPGEMAHFQYLHPDIGIITGIAPEHMENFSTLDAVAEEELLLASYSKKMLLNTDDTAPEYAKTIKYQSYGLLMPKKGYYAENGSTDPYGQNIICYKNGAKIAATHIQFLGAQGRKIALAAAAVADMLDVPHHHLAQALEGLSPFSGRMQILPGIKKATLIDDTYNATPAAVEAALQVLNDTKATQRIAVLGSMNELGDYAVEAHKTIGASIDPKKVSLVVTVGTLARDYIAPAAKENGCVVYTFLNPQKAGEFVKTHLKEKAVVLCKGSQNGVFTEEALKPLLANNADQAKLVRQSSFWMKRKQSILSAE